MVLSLYSGRPCCYLANGLGEIIRTILNDQVKEEITSAVESYFRFGRECRSKRAQNVVNSTHKLVTNIDPWRLGVDSTQASRLGLLIVPLRTFFEIFCFLWLSVFLVTGGSCLVASNLWP